MFSKKRRGGVPGKSAKWKKLEELVLPNAKLRFCPDQLQNLNYIFNKRLQQRIPAEAERKTWLLARSVTERLVQRLVCGAGMLDARFSSKYLISDTNQQSNNMSNQLEYMIRLDGLSTPNLYETDSRPKYSVIETDSDYPAAYARVRLHTSAFKVWGDYTNSNGYLRRDKVQARLVELLALAASKDTPNSPLHVDESVVCGIPGKIVDSVALYNILKIPPNQHIYYGPGGNIPRFPDPRDFRLAIVDEPSGIRLRVEFLSPALSNISIDVRILVAIGIDAWPSSTDFPSRVSLGHSDCLMYHQAAQTGMYLVGYGVQSSAWHIRMPAAEYMLLNHYGPNSTVATVLDMLYNILDDIDDSRRFGKQHISYKILTNHIFLTLVLEKLEENSKSPVVDMIKWSPIYLSTHILQILDKVIPRLHSEKQSNYFFKKSNLFVNPGHLSDDDFTMEANNVKAIMIRLFDESIMSTKDNGEFNRGIIAQESELILLHKWKDMVDSLLPLTGTRGRRFCFAGSRNRQHITHTQYSIYQLEYIGMLLNKMLNADFTLLDDQLTAEDYDRGHPLEDVIFILVTIMDQARDQYLSSQTNPNVIKNQLKIKSNYNTYTTKLVELMRKDNELETFNFEDDLALVKIIIKWLYKAMDQNKRYLAPILRPYLNNLFNTSHAMSWHIDFIKEKMKTSDIESLGAFADLVNSGKVTPAQGIVDFVNKNCTWATSMLKMVEDSTLRIVFVSDRGQTCRHILSLPSNNQKEVQNGSKTLESPRVAKDSQGQKTLPGRNYFSTILKESNDNDDKGWMFQEVASALPSEDRTQLFDLIQSIHTARSKKIPRQKMVGYDTPVELEEQTKSQHRNCSEIHTERRECRYKDK
ncbi:hypothetical protein NQ317_005654 [Molorchus minor]|uniref:Mab-21-like HhH/H2TH-like domain-containing protein n=1 Tax=Molorchus minor TaxID=1323400 RepID=A0ABQ9K9I4_9CUCU|nr:hypothetical protein NQ317_005654 [Molorchus minor]